MRGSRCVLIVLPLCLLPKAASSAAGPRLAVGFFDFFMEQYVHPDNL